MQSIRIQLDIAWNGEQKTVQLPVDMPVGRILAALKSQLGLPEGDYSLRLYGMYSPLEEDTTFAILKVADGASVFLDRVKPSVASAPLADASVDENPNVWALKRIGLGGMVVLLASLLPFFWLQNLILRMEEFFPRFLYPTVIGGIVFFLIFKLIGKTTLFQFDTKHIPLVMLAALLCGVQHANLTATVFSMLDIPQYYWMVIPTGLRLLAPMFIGLTVGPAAGFLTGVIGFLLYGVGIRSGFMVPNLLGAGLVGLLSGLAHKDFAQVWERWQRPALWIALGVMAIAILGSLGGVRVPDPWGNRGPSHIEMLWIIFTLSIIIALIAALRPESWPILLVGFTGVMLVVGWMEFLRTPAWMAALASGTLALYLKRSSPDMRAWSEEKDTAAIISYASAALVFGNLLAVLLMLLFADAYYLYGLEPFPFMMGYLGVGVPIELVLAIIFLPGLNTIWKRSTQR